MSEKRTDNRQGQTLSGRYGSEAMTQVVEAQIVEPRCTPYPAPRLLKVDEARSWLIAADDVRIVP